MVCIQTAAAGGGDIYLDGRPGAPQRLVHHAGTGYSQSRPIMTTDSTPSKKRSLLRKLLYAAAAVILLGSLLASYMNWEANHLEFSENTAPAGCVPGTFRTAHPGAVRRPHQSSPAGKSGGQGGTGQAGPMIRVPGRPVHGFSAGHPRRRLHHADETGSLPSPRPTRAWATMTWPWWTTWSAF